MPIHVLCAFATTEASMQHAVIIINSCMAFNLFNELYRTPFSFSTFTNSSSGK